MTWLAHDDFRNFYGRPGIGTVVHKFGSADVGNTFQPITFGGVWRMPQTGGATALRVKAGNAQDKGTASPGNGARSVKIEGLDASGNYKDDTLTTNGTSASTNSNNSYMRLNRAYVVESGSYADVNAPTWSHAANIVIEKAAGSEDWLTIDVTAPAKAQSEVACYAVPNGKTAYVTGYHFTLEAIASQTFDMIFAVREDITNSTFTPLLTKLRLVGLDPNVQTSHDHYSRTPLGPYTGPCDLVWLGKIGSGNGTISLDFEIVEI